jgi:predicted nucleotidyltransferase
MTATQLPLERLSAGLLAGPPLRFAMLFGSAAKGTMRADSDVDVAIYPQDSSLPLATELALQTELTRLCGRDVDLIRLDRAQTLVCWQVVRYGRLLIEQVPFSASRFTAHAIGEYLDFAPAFDRAAETFRRQLVARPSDAAS